MPQVNFSTTITKFNEELGVVYGWASVIKEGNEYVVDRQGDVIQEDELLKAAHDFVINERNAKVMHVGEVKGEIVESLIFTDDLQKALGIDLKKVGWFIGMKLNDKEVLKQVKSGELKAFSIGGKGIRQQIA
jgi:hypothetical protein